MGLVLGQSNEGLLVATKQLVSTEKPLRETLVQTFPPSELGLALEPKASTIILRLNKDAVKFTSGTVCFGGFYNANLADYFPDLKNPKPNPQLWYWVMLTLKYHNILLPFSRTWHSVRHGNLTTSDSSGTGLSIPTSCLTSQDSNLWELQSIARVHSGAEPAHLPDAEVAE